MLDLAGILFSSIMMLFVIVRAVQLDATQSWFQTLSPKSNKKEITPATWQRRG